MYHLTIFYLTFLRVGNHTNFKLSYDFSVGRKVNLKKSTFRNCIGSLFSVRSYENVLVTNAMCHFSLNLWCLYIYFVTITLF